MLTGNCLLEMSSRFKTFVLLLQVVELQADLAEENTTSSQASELLETESAERMRLEKELKDVQVGVIYLCSSLVIKIT